MPEEERPHLQVLQEERSKLQALVDTDGWKWIFAIGQGRVSAFLNELVSTPATEVNVDKTVSWLFQIGQLAEAKRILDLPQAQIAVLTDQIEALIEEQEDARRERTGEPGDDDGEFHDGSGDDVSP